MKTSSYGVAWSEHVVQAVEFITDLLGEPTETTKKAYRWVQGGRLLVAVRVDTGKRFASVTVPGLEAARALPTFTKTRFANEGRFSNLGPMRYGGELSMASVTTRRQLEELRPFIH